MSVRSTFPPGVFAPLGYRTTLRDALSTEKWRQVLWPKESTLLAANVRASALAYAALALPYLVWYWMDVRAVLYILAFVLVNVAAVVTLTMQKERVGQNLVIFVMPLFVYLGCALVIPQEMLTETVNARVILMGQALSPFLILRSNQQRLLLIAVLYYGFLLLSLDLAVEYMPVKLEGLVNDSQMGKLLSSGAAFLYVAVLFWNYRQRGIDKDEEVTYLVEALTENAVQLNQVNRDLKQSQEELERMNESKDRLFSIIAHDLRTPLSTFEAFSRLLANHADQLTTQEVREMTLGMRKSFGQVRTMLDNLLTWSRNQMHHIESRPVSFNLYDVIEEVAGCYREVAASKHITIDLNVNPVLPIVADPDMLSTVLRNLLSNALKYSQDGGVIEVNAGRITETAVRLEVRDYGVGMDEETQVKLFSIGAKKSKVGTCGEKGTGIGMLVVRDFLRLMGSDLNLNSRVGEGTTFWFNLAFQQD